jgi:hypothetical protein
MRNESCYASHRMLPGALNDGNPKERAMGIEVGFAWREVAQATVVYHDLGFSHGMQLGIIDAQHLRRNAPGLVRFHSGRHTTMWEHAIEYRLLGGEWDLGLSEIGRP